MELSKYKACICEGSAESAIMDILLDNDLLIFTREELLEEKVIRRRDGKRFEERHLRKLPEECEGDPEFDGTFRFLDNDGYLHGRYRGEEAGSSDKSPGILLSL